MQKENNIGADTDACARNNAGPGSRCNSECGSERYPDSGINTDADAKADTFPRT